MVRVPLITTAEFVSDVVLRSEGKLPTFTTGSTKWLRIVAQGNYFLRQFARERGIKWNRYYDPYYSIGTVTATDSFELDDDIAMLSPQEGDFVRITHTNDQTTDYTLIPHTALKEHPYGSYVTKIGRTLRFNATFTSDSQQFGGTITVPAYVAPETFSADSDEIDHDNPNWLVCIVAADRVKNDVTRKDLRADLLAEANDIMQGLKEENDSQHEQAYMPWNPTAHTDTDWWLA